MKLRIYPDVHVPGIWCIDRGTNATEKRVNALALVGISGIARFNPKADNENEPKYWIEVDGEDVINDRADTALIFGNADE